MCPNDIAAGMRLKALAGWNQVEDDWRFFLDHRPEGCFVAVRADRVIGTVTTTCYGRALAWISMLLVDPAHRGRGIGTRLMQAAIASLAGRPTIALDATPAGQALYERLGFREQSRLLRLATDSLPTPGAPPEEWALRPLGSDEALDRVAGLDRHVFGADRVALLQALARRAPEAAWASRCDGHITGFCLGRDGARFQQLGPLAAETDEQAVVLCRAGLSAWSGKAVLLDVPAAHRNASAQGAFVDWLCGVGFAVQRPFTRMVLGEPLARSEAPARQFVICGPEYG
jgi:GNAT superfamily N-acetyltransferase